MQLAVHLLIILLSAVSTEPATSPTTAPADSPKSALLAYNAAMRNGDVPTMLTLQHATNEEQTHVARCCAQSDLQVGALLNAAMERFGETGRKLIAKTVEDQGDDEIATGTESIDGDRAKINFPAAGQPTSMIRVDGRWKIDLSDFIKKLQSTPDEFCDQLIHRGSAAKVTAQELKAGQYSSAQAASEALASRMKETN